MKKLILLLVLVCVLALLSADDTFSQDLLRRAEAGEASAQFDLGWCYYSGEGVVQNYKEAVKWCRMAAEQGDADAQFNLGVCYGKGKGVVLDYDEAYFWLLIASANGQTLAPENRDIVGGKLTQQKREQIQARAAKWFADEQPDTATPKPKTTHLYDAPPGGTGNFINAEEKLNNNVYDTGSGTGATYQFQNYLEPETPPPTGD